MEVHFPFSGDTPDTKKLTKLIKEKYQALHTSLREKKVKGIPIKFEPDEKLLVEVEKGEVVVIPSTNTKTLIHFLSEYSSKIKPFKLSKTTINKPSIIDTSVKEWVPETSKISLAKGQVWSSLSHNGVYLGEPYNPSKVGIVVDGKTHKLSPEDEELLNLYAVRMEQEQNNSNVVKYTQNLAFIGRYVDDLKKLLSKQTYNLIKPQIPKTTKDIPKFNSIFKNLVKHNASQREKNKDKSKASTLEKKAQTLKLQKQYKYAVINGRKEEIGNFKVEPPALFYGRGESKRAGCIKSRISSSDVTINIGKGEKVPIPNDGGKWGKVVHDKEASWIAKWHDRCGDGTKYVHLARTSSVVGSSSMKKYEKARSLGKVVDKIVKSYEKLIRSKSEKERQLGTVVYFIDHFAFRVGNEKGEKDADTVGASTLKVENVTPTSGSHTVTFDFLGKDSIRYVNTKDLPKEVYDNVVAFRKKKKGSDLLFDEITSSDINKYLKTFSPYLSAKVFRTYRASSKYFELLSKIKSTLSPEEKLKKEGEANRAVALLCNHQKKVSAVAEAAVEKKKVELKKLKKDVKELDGKKKDAMKKKITKLEGDIETKQANMSVACSTSKLNYIDPRIAVAWAKKNDVDVKKLFTGQMLKSFAWALNTDKKWDYESSSLDIATPSKPKFTMDSPKKKVSSEKKVKTPKKKVSEDKPKKKKVKTPEDKSKKKVKTPEDKPKKKVKTPEGKPKKKVSEDKKKAKTSEDNPKKKKAKTPEDNPKKKVKTPEDKTKKKVKTPEDKTKKKKVKTPEDKPKKKVSEDKTKKKVKTQDKTTPSLKYVVYGENSVVVFGNTLPIKSKLQDLNGKYNGALKSYPHAGWVFSKKKLHTLKQTFSGLEEVKEAKTVKSNVTLRYKKYSDVSVVIFGEETISQKEKLKESGGRWNDRLKGGLKGWIFPLSKLETLKKYFEMKLVE